MRWKFLGQRVRQRPENALVPREVDTRVWICSVVGRRCGRIIRLLGTRFAFVCLANQVKRVSDVQHGTRPMEPIAVELSIAIRTMYPSYEQVHRIPEEEPMIRQRR